MHTLLAVIDDLYQFAIGSLLDLSKGATRTEDDEDVYLYESLGVTDAVTGTTSKESVSSFRQVGDVFTASREGSADIHAKNTVMYIGTSEAALYAHPTLEFDTIVAELSYGTMAMVLEQRGRWAKVVAGEHSGWVLREDLVDRAIYVYPQFVIGEKNAEDDPNTHRVRAILSDMFGGAAAGLPLQAGEYVTYRLLRKGLSIDWPEVRPRTPGLWHTVLKGVPGIHIGITPKPGSVMEYMMTEEIGHLAYTEAVFPDETINVSEVNYPEDGIYNERVLTQEEWKELKPVFIEVLGQTHS